jgi:hypothetical protein
VNKSRKMKWVGYVARKGHKKGASRIFVEKPVGKRLLERPRCKWEDNIKIGLQVVE